METPYFSLIVWAHDTDIDMFKDMLESIDEQDYSASELYIMDENRSLALEMIIKEFFPDIVDKVHYRRLKNSKGGAYAYNIGSRFAEGNFLVYLGQHDRLSPRTLTEFAAAIEDTEAEDIVIYTDHDELVGQDRMNPHFKEHYNKELLLHTHYMGDFICISKNLYKKCGNFQEKAIHAYIYDYILRCCFKKATFLHVSALLYHVRRIEKGPLTKEEKRLKTYAYKEHMALAGKYLRLNGMNVELRPDAMEKRWNIDYDYSDYRRFSKDYIFLHDDKVKLVTRHNVERLYGYLKQPDVAVVGVRFMGRLFTYDSLGYVVDKDGFSYPAFHGQKIYHQTYEDLSMIPRDVTFVDAGCCLIDAKVYKGLGGFNSALTGRDAMLDFCMRARQKGYRTIVVPECIAKYRFREDVSSQASHELLMSLWGDELSKGDPFYNLNLPMGYNNYLLPGEDGEFIYQPQESENVENSATDESQTTSSNIVQM